MLLSVFSRHSRDCKYAGDRTYRRCNCPKWIGGQVDREYFRKSARTRQWNEAEEYRLQLEEALAKGLPPFRPLPPEMQALVALPPAEPPHREPPSPEVLPPTPKKPRVTIAGLGCHAGGGEDWADEENAMTAAEAQAFKRASSCFGLGRYLYNLAEIWVPLNEHRQPVRFPTLPQWALPKAGNSGKTHPAAGSRPPVVQQGPVDQKITVRIEGFRRILGDRIYREILWRAAHARQANEIPNAQLQVDVADAMERASRGIRKAHSLAESIGDTQFVSVLDRLHIGSMTTIRNLEALKHLVSELEGLSRKPAA